MAVRTALLNGNNINLDSDFSKYVESLTSQWVISWFDMTTTSVGVGKAFVQCTRTNGETIMVYVENTESIAISGNWYIVIKVPQAMIDDWTNNPADWIGIATVELVETLPSANYMTLWQIVGGVLADVRYFIPKAQAFETNINNLLSRMTTAEADIEALQLAWIPDHLEQSWVIWEKYTSSNQLFIQWEPTANDSTITYGIWNVAANTQVHIQRIWSWTASNTITLKVKMVWSPTTTLHCDVYAWQSYAISTTRTGWYATWTALATSSKVYTTFTTSWQNITFTLNNSVWWTKGQLLDIVVYQEWNIVNASNYYQIACDSTQKSEAFSCISVNWTTRTPSNLMPYCYSAWFLHKLICKVNKTISYDWSEVQLGWLGWRWWTSYNKIASFSKPVKITKLTCGNYNYCHIYFTLWVASDTNYTDVNFSWSGNSATKTVSVVNENALDLYARATDSNSTYYINNVNFYWIYGSYFNANHREPIWIPTEVKNIWQSTNINIFWVNGDSFFSWWETTVITTWSIAPGNFVWYVQLWKYKIPYYT